jgi:hypothetical protein
VGAGGAEQKILLPGRLPARVRALIDFLVHETDLDDALELSDTVSGPRSSI